MSSGPSGPRSSDASDPAGDRREDDPGGLRERPPFLGEWRNLYALVVAVLVLQILLFGWISRVGR